jgi:hypothetical protein
MPNLKIKYGAMFFGFIVIDILFFIIFIKPSIDEFFLLQKKLISLNDLLLPIEKQMHKETDQKPPMSTLEKWRELLQEIKIQHLNLITINAKDQSAHCIVQGEYTCVRQFLIGLSNNAQFTIEEFSLKIEDNLLILDLTLYLDNLPAVPADPYAMGQHKNREAFLRFSAGVADNFQVLLHKRNKVVSLVNDFYNPFCGAINKSYDVSEKNLFSVHHIKMVGMLHQLNNKQAILLLPNAKSLLVRSGDVIAKEHIKVIAIEDQCLQYRFPQQINTKYLCL